MYASLTNFYITYQFSKIAISYYLGGGGARALDAQWVRFDPYPKTDVPLRDIEQHIVILEGRRYTQKNTVVHFFRRSTVLTTYWSGFYIHTVFDIMFSRNKFSTGKP